MNEKETAQKLIGEFIRIKDTLDYANLSEDNKYLGWVSNFNFNLPNGEKMHLDLNNDNDKFLLFALAVAWSRTGPWENAAAFVAYLKMENKDNPEYWLNSENIEYEKENRVDNALKTRKQLIEFSHRKKISFREDIFESMNILAENWDEINKHLEISSVNGDYIPLMKYLRSIEGLAGKSRRMNIKIPLILREFRCQNVYDNIPGELCCVPDERVYNACENLNIHLPKFRKRDIDELISISRIIYGLFGDLYDLPLFAYEEPEIKAIFNFDMIDTNKLKDDLELSTGDAAAAVTKATISLIPFLGGPAVELFEAVTGPMLAKRRDKWMIMFAEVINELRGRMDEFSFEKLPENEVFITTVMHASQIAIRNHQKEKLQALKNAVINSALSNVPEEDLHLIFLDFVDSFTPLHLKLLKFFSEPKSEKFIQELDMVIGRDGDGTDENGYYAGYKLEKAIEYIFPELKDKSYIYERVLQDLTTKDLLLYGGTGLKVYPNIKLNPKITILGKKFLAFISCPIE